jgi:AcrR family transcriptional regulator
MQGRERINQKRRTRAALVEAARALIAEGKEPTVAEVADAALVSRATAYRYFPMQEFLLIDAALDPSTALSGIAPSPDDNRSPEAQVDSIVAGLQQRVVENEDAFRSLLSLALQASAQRDHELLRAGLRVQWFRAALRPWRRRLGARHHDRLVAALSLCVGIEALVTLRDICGLEPEEAKRVSRWAAQALIHAALREEQSSNDPGNKKMTKLAGRDGDRNRGRRRPA